MPINSLESFLFERKLVSVSPVELLQNSTLGIDVEHYLGRIYTYKKEQLLLGIGGIPVSLKAYIESDLAVFQEFNIRPLFVFPGLLIHRQHSPSTNELTDAEKHREATWTRLHSKWANLSGTPSVHLNESFRPPNELISSHPMINDLIKYFIEYDIDFIVSPSDPSHQLSYLFHNEVIDCIYGSTDLLLTQIDKFILGMEFLSKDFRFVDKKKVLNELNLSESQLLEISVIAGCSAQPVTFPTLPPMPKHNPASQFQQMTHFKYVLDLMYQYKSFQNEPNLYSYVAAFNDDALISLYCKGIAAIKYMPVMNLHGEVKLYITEMVQSRSTVSTFVNDVKDVNESEEELRKTSIGLNIPTEVHNVLSQRLPSEFYFYMSLGLMPSKVLEAIALNRLSVRPPLEGGLCEEYRTLVTSAFTSNVLDAQFNLVTQLLARYYQVKRIPVDFWFTDDIHNLNTRMSTSVSARLNMWTLNTQTDSFTLKGFLKHCPSLSEDPQVTEEPSKMSDIISTSTLRALILINSADPSHQLASFVVRVLKELLLEYPDMDDLALGDIMITVILVKLRIYSFFSLDSRYQSVPNLFKVGNHASSQLNVEQRLQILVISRIFSVQKLSINPINYQGPVSRSLLSFRSHHQFLSQLVGDSVRLCLVDMIARHKTFKLLLENRKQWYSIVDQLPFYEDSNNTLLGVVSEIYFDGCLKFHDTKCSVEDSRQRSIDHLLNNVMQQSNPTFNINLASCNSVTSSQMVSDLMKGLEFWKYFVSSMRIAQRLDDTFLEKSSWDLIENCDQVALKFLTGLV